MIICKVCETSGKSKQKSVTIPKDCGIEKGDYVYIVKVMEEFNEVCNSSKGEKHGRTDQARN